MAGWSRRDFMHAGLQSVAAAALGSRTVFAAHEAVNDWPQLQGNPGHTGFTPHEPRPPYRLRWASDLQEPTQSAAQVVLSGDKLFVGTGWGNLYALNLDNGETLWGYRTAAPIFGTPAVNGDRVYITSCDRCLHAVEAQTGRGIWRFETEEPLWAAPVVADERLYLAGRDGFVYAIDQEGRQIWRSPVGGPVLCTPAYSEGVLYVGAGDMHVYALDGKSGNLIWKSAKIPGAAFREYWLVAAHNTVLLTVQNPLCTRQVHEQLNRLVMEPFVESHAGDEILVEDEIFPALVEQFRKHPHWRTHFALDAASGKEKFIPRIVGVEGGGCISMPPAVDADGWAYTMYGNLILGASGKAFLGRFHLNDGRMEPLLKNRFAGPKVNWEQLSFVLRPGRPRGPGDFYGGFSVMDQSWGITVAGSRVFAVRDPGHPREPPHFNWHDLRTGESGAIEDRRRELQELGSYGCGYHSTCSAPAICGNLLAYKSSRSVVIVYEGQ